MLKLKNTSKYNDNGIARLAATNAVLTLKESTEGYLALCEFRAMLGYCGYQLDSRSWAALADLCTVAAAGKLFAVHEQFPAARRKGRHKTPASRKE